MKRPQASAAQYMTGVWLEQGGVSVRRDLPKPTPREDEAVIKVSLAGICGTDLALLQGYAGFRGIPGHEFCGVVEACPSVPGLVGRRVVAEINLPCGACRHCQAGRTHHCLRRKVIGIRDRPGAFAESVAVPVNCLHAVPDGVPDEAAVFVEPLAAALRIPQQIDLSSVASVLLIGAGRLGQLLARVLATLGLRPDVVIRHSRQGELLGGFAAHLLQAEEVPDRAFDLVVDASGSAGGLELGLRAVRPLGTLVLKSTLPKRVRLDGSALVVNEIKLVGSRCGPFGRALEHLQRGLEVKPLIDAILPLEAAERAFELAARPGAMKILLRTDS